jgi:saccharopine dehydrogenase (NAD+, L-lysine-forming)
MSKVVVLGGCGAVGSVAAKTLAARTDFTEVVIGDMNMAKARELAAANSKITVVEVDASDAQSIKKAGADVVLNCVGPFYRTVQMVLSAVIESGINYVDICDDVDVTLDILALDETAKRAGVTAVIGMGASPGATNLLAKYLVETQLEEAETIDIFHCHGGQPIEGAGGIGQRSMGSLASTA